MNNRRRLFIASCVALVANAMQFSICTDIMGDFERHFHFTKLELSKAVFGGAIAGVVVQLLGGALLDILGMGAALWLAAVAQACGVTIIIFAQGSWSLAVGWTFMAIAGGLIEATINPLAATEYPDQKTHMLNVLHAWWPGGMIIGGLAAFGFSAALNAAGASEHLKAISWQIKMSFVYVPILLYAVLIFGQKFPKTERAQAGVSTEAMFQEALRPMFLLLVFCMFLTASTELAPARWVGVFVGDIVKDITKDQAAVKPAVSDETRKKLDTNTAVPASTVNVAQEPQDPGKFRGVIVLVYLSGLMFVLRFFAGPLAKKLSPLGIMIGSAILSALGLLALSYSGTIFTVFAAATVFGIGVTYFWPTMLGITSERFPKGGALLLGIIGAAGALFWSYVAAPGMGKLHDHYTLQSLSPTITQQVVVKGRVDEDKLKALPNADKKSAQEAVDHARKTAASTTFRWVAVFPAVLIVLFGGMFLHDRRRGGYKQEILTPPSGG